MLGAMLIAAAFAGASPEPPTGWGGVNPFVCELQQAGLEARGPNPDADPYCIEFDKRYQNVTQFGVVEFLSKEPDRVTAAGPKCFYFQSDHWRGSVVQEDGSTKTYEWDGHYFFDKAYGEGGIWVTNFNINGHTADPSQIPGMPPEYAQHFGPGTGGFITRNDGEVDPECLARAQAEPERIYSRPPGPAGPTGGPRGCVDARAFGGLTRSMRDREVRAKLGDPQVVRRGFLRYCAIGGGALLVGQPGDRSGTFGRDPVAPTVMLASTSSATVVRGVRPGARFERRGWRLAARLGTRRVWRRGSTLVVERRRRVRTVAVYSRASLRSRGMLRSFLRRAGA